MLRKTLLGLTGFTLLTAGVVVPWLLHDRDAPTALAADAGAVVLRGLVAREAAPAAPLAPDFGASREQQVTVLAPAPAALDAAPGRALDAAPSQALTTDEQKAVDKLAKKLAKAQARIEKAELKQAQVSDDQATTEALLDDANNLPDGTEKELKAKLKLIAKLEKKLLKLQAKLDKGQAKLDELDDFLDVLSTQITELDPEHFAAIAGLQAPEQLSVVTADAEGGEGGGAAIFGGGDFLLGEDDFPLLSDYNQDPQHRFVYDPSMKTLDTVNMILCLLAQTAYDEMVNAGIYVAQIDESLCNSGDDSSSSGSDSGESSGGNAEAPQLWVVKSTRESEDSSQLVKFWLPQEAEGDGGSKSGTIRGKLEVTQGVSDNDPFGAFNLNFAMVPTGGDLEDAVEFGNLRTLDVQEGFIGFSFFQTEGDIEKPVFLPGEHAEITQANVNMFDDQSQAWRASAASTATTWARKATPACRPRSSCWPSTTRRCCARRTTTSPSASRAPTSPSASSATRSTKRRATTWARASIATAASASRPRAASTAGSATTACGRRRT